jgi:magnesium transporter
MTRTFYKEGNELIWVKNPASLELNNQQEMVWVDLQRPAKEEQKLIEDKFGIEFFTQQEAAEIESSSRYLEDADIIEANSGFVVLENASYNTKQVSFILKDGILFTLRRDDLKSFAETVRKLKLYNAGNIKAIQIWLLLLESQIDLDADFIEYLSRSTNKISKKLAKKQPLEEEILLGITALQENTILIRESIVDMQRLVSSLLKSTTVAETEKERIRILIKDINSLIQHTQFSFERLEYLQNTFLGLINIEQNQVIKIFTVVTVIFMPPTLIASIYGMNFNFMPELEWKLGYPFAVLLMILSSVFFLWYFKRKKWL